MQDGTRYKGTGTLKHGRTIRTERSDHIRAMDNQDSLQRMADFAAGTIAKPTGRECAPCRFMGWSWTYNCPKCGEPTTEVTQ